MRNLLGRLNARSPEELNRIAAAWQIPVSGGDKLGQVAQLYRALSDPRTARDMWARLPDDERALAGVLALGDETSRPLDDIAAILQQPATEVRQIATRLYHRGIIAREGDDDPLPVGEAPRLFLPRELGQLFQRVQDEIEAGDVSATPLRTLLSLLDDREVEEAAEAWGVRVIPGLRTRDELIRQLLQNVGDRHRLATVEGRLKQDAARIWERARDAVDGKPIPYGEAALAAGLNADEPRQALRLRQALAELEETLLVWHTYRADGSRWLFVPTEIRSPGTAPATAGAVELPAAVATPDDLPPARHAHAVAWDLLTLLRALSPPQDHRIHDVDEAPRGWLRRLNHDLWNRGTETPPAGYLEFLIDLARVEGLLTGGDAAVEEPFQVSPIVRQWRDRAFPEQTDRLRATWLASSTWIEGIERDEVEVWGADWTGFRFKLLAHLALLESGTFYRLDAVAEWLANRDPEMLGTTFEVATARNTEIVTDEAASRRAAVAEVARVTLEAAFAWFGLVEIVSVVRQPRLMRITDTGAAIAHGTPRAESPAPSGPALTVSAEGEIRLRLPSPLTVWSVSAFADLSELSVESRYMLTERSVARALRAGFEIRQIERFLASQSGGTLPEGLSERLQSWSTGVRRVRMTRLMRLTPDDPAVLPELTALLESAGVEAIATGGELFVPIEDREDLSPREAQLLARLREAGFTPQGLASPKPAPPRPRPVEPRHRQR
ncbi:MAG: helicase-associated domain-containing protein [Thermomicrobiales bacterium]|nr:helicase-associated domain-containing protein [Thermomicrobiales bacterium]